MSVVRDIAPASPPRKYHPPSVGAFTRIAPACIVRLCRDSPPFAAINELPAVPALDRVAVQARGWRHAFSTAPPMCGTVHNPKHCFTGRLEAIGNPPVGKVKKVGNNADMSLASREIGKLLQQLYAPQLREPLSDQLRGLVRELAENEPDAA
jgi:hypothetical protein